jgi:hypothetical protein
MRKWFATAALMAAPVFAQDTTSPPPPPPPVAPSAVALTPADAPLEEGDPGGRVRWGVSGKLGWNFPQSAFTFGAEGRVGYQLSNAFSLYGALGAAAGFGFGASFNANGNSASVSVTALSYYYFAAVAEGILGDVFYFGGGPVLASAALLGVSSTGGTSGGEITTYVANGFAPGLTGRLGLNLGRARGAPTFRRGGFNIGIDTTMLIYPNALVGKVAVDSSGNAGAEVRGNAPAVTVSPMLVLGYDAR